MIRPLRQKDIGQIIAIEEATFASPWTRQAFEEEIRNDRAHYLVYEKEGTLIGYGGFWEIIDEGHITNIAILEAKRQQGHGKTLIQALVNLARRLGIQSMTLEVRQSNQIAILAYERLGFSIEGKRKDYYRNPTEDAMIMWNDIANKEAMNS